MRSINSSSRDNTFLTRRGTDKSEKSVTFGTYNGGTPSSEIGRSASVKSYSESVNSSIQPRAKDGELDSSNFSFSVANQSANSLPNASVLVPIDNEVLNSSAPAVQQSAIAASTTRPTISRTLTRPLYRNSSFTVHRQISLSSSKNVRGWKTSTNTPKKFTTLRKLSTADVCSICLEEYVVGDDLLRLPEPCSHVYHGKCVVEWISETSPTCPMCRRNIRDLLLEIKNIDDVEKEEKVAISSSLEET
ncbi:E3 ubiquitin-protein ligase rnf13 [Nowakowskiella sp. JEL0407]|nr:E3 ubiquitin-protein ligase rnf13 [Nowakowskiella sp. JEL0407]